MSLLYRCNAWQFFAFDGFKQSAAASGDIRHLVGETELVDASHGVATADERESTVLGGCCNGFSDGLGAFGEGVELKHAAGTVPKNGFRAFDDIGEQFAGLGTDIHAFPAFGDVHRVNDLGVGIVAELITNYAVDGENEIDAFFLGFGKDVEGEVKFVVFADGITNLAAESLLEGVGHATAEDEVVDLSEQILNDLNLGRNL